MGRDRVRTPRPSAATCCAIPDERGPAMPAVPVHTERSAGVDMDVDLALDVDGRRFG
jgi:hypothetical protein